MKQVLRINFLSYLLEHNVHPIFLKKILLDTTILFQYHFIRKISFVSSFNVHKMLVSERR